MDPDELNLTAMAVNVIKGDNSTIANSENM